MCNDRFLIIILLYMRLMGDVSKILKYMPKWRETDSTGLVAQW